MKSRYNTKIDSTRPECNIEIDKLRLQCGSKLLYFIT